MPKKELETLGFRIYLYDTGPAGQSAKGKIAFLDKGDTQKKQKTFNHFDEIPGVMRKLLMEAGYVKRAKDDGWWCYEKK